MININNFNNKNSFSLDRTPDECPYCHRKIRPKVITAYYDDELRAKLKDRVLRVFMACPNLDCNESFIATYKLSELNYSNAIYSGYTTQGILIEKAFDNIIENISPSFSKIYNQAYAAEQAALDEICGVGYRKALEFLIKDYSIKHFPEQEEQIKKKQLAQCIGDHIASENIKKVAKRAVWLGNDETHYVRKWEGKTLADLKSLIDLTTHWIIMEELTNSIEEDMPG
jgi:hypothetical protein